MSPAIPPCRRTRRLPHNLTLLLLITAPLAQAHTGGDAAHVHDGLSAFIDGFIHPFTGLDHLAAMVTLGVWCAMTMQRVVLTPLAFVVALLAGALLARAGLALPGIEPMIAASSLVLGLLVLSGTRLPLALGMGLAAVFALFHGAAHGQELSGPAGAWAMAGMVLATALLHGSGIGLGLLLKRRPEWLSRAAGSAVALYGAFLLLPVALLGRLA
jgi:urease accessory protein